MNREQFEVVLQRAAEILTENLRSSQLYRGPEQFEQGVLDMLKVAAEGLGVTVEPTFHAHAFPDIRVNGYGVEVKYSVRDTWNAVGNSVFESMRDPSVSKIYVMFGKVGGNPEARWARYEDCIKHVRVSNAPRFVVDLDSEEPPLFERFDISYTRFSGLDEDGKMAHVRDYWRKRLPQGEHLWWLEPSHTLPINVRLYMNLSQSEKRKLRAEAALLCPQICKGSLAKRKYEDAAMYLLTYHGVFCPQTRDLFTAGSVADHIEPIFPNEPFVSRALRDIESLMIDAADRLDDALFLEYWGTTCPPKDRLSHWLIEANRYAEGWTPSEFLFQNQVHI